MKRSADRAEPALPLDLERDHPVTRQDVEVLRRLRYERLSPGAYESLLELLGDAPCEVLERRRGPCGEPFEL